MRIRAVVVLCVMLLLAVSSGAAMSYADYLNGIIYPVVDSINGTHLWVPWFDRDDSCTISNLHSGSSCNSGQTIDFTHNCMVMDEFSQLGVLYAYDATSDFNQWVNTVQEIPSAYGKLPAWRVYRNGNQIEPCRAGINSNCDTASDATARIIVALYAGSQTFTDSSYSVLATELAGEHIQYETVHSCYTTVRGEICYWLGAGAGAASGGRSSTDFSYTGYYPDAIIAMQLACRATGNQTFCDIADQYQQQYLLAAAWNGQSFSAPPGRSWKWVGMQAVCTNTCTPDQWDAADAPRALAICGISNKTADMELYCEQWLSATMGNPTGTPLQYRPDGTVSGTYQNGYFAQGLAAQFYNGWLPTLQQWALEDALSHYNNQTKVWDNQQCFGIYGKAFALRVLGESQTILQFAVQNFSGTNTTVFEQQTDTLNDSNVSVVDLSAPIDSPPQQNLQNQRELRSGPLFGSGPSNPDPVILAAYQQKYNKSDMPLIVADGIGTAGASVVADAELIVIALLFAGFLAFAQKIKRR